MSLMNNKPEEIYLNVRIVEENNTQTLIKVKEVEVSNCDVKCVHFNGDINIAKFTSPASIFLMVGKDTVDHLKY